MMVGGIGGAQVFAGVCIVLGAVAAVAARVAKVGWRWEVKE